MTLALKLFRGEPAISGFDWNFSAIHTSSAAFSTEVGSVLHGAVSYTHLDVYKRQILYSMHYPLFVKKDCENITIDTKSDSFTIFYIHDLGVPKCQEEKQKNLSFFLFF